MQSPHVPSYTHFFIDFRPDQASWLSTRVYSHGGRNIDQDGEIGRGHPFVLTLIIRDLFISLDNLRY